ncbi:hypothetical protein IW261DRAFT_1426341 [Armillaria novae-zelandiae]|uniref:Uncharacterized protein n=1 Tax=Armillaria novae-zelandiae TaxID=153914 RepID=A0AA39NN27_9AGAR|nr:hypothetical protein IW261DRAFT_1426341 [Armillaria novae-zelandiae]
MLFFGNTKQIYPHSPYLVDEFLAKVLLEVGRRYAGALAHEGVDKLSIFSGWHTSLQNPWYHYTLRGYNRLGWMAVTLEMEAANQGMVFTYNPRDWNRWMLHSGGLRAKHFFHFGDHVEGKSLNFINYLAGGWSAVFWWIEGQDGAGGWFVAEVKDRHGWSEPEEYARS